MRPDTPASAQEHPFLNGGGELAALIAAHDWRQTALGPISGWPQSLKSAIGWVLRSDVPMVLLWGADGVMIYNKAYSAFAGARHPTLLGSKVREGWPEVAEFNDHVMRVVLAGGTLAYRDREMTLHRHGRPEQVWMNLDYSPVLDEAGQPAGVIAVVTETTAAVLAERSHKGEMRASERRNRQILDSAIEYAIVATDLAGSIMRWNEGARRTLEWSEDEALGQHLSIFFTAEDCAAGQPEKEMRRALEEGHARDERWHRRKSGEHFWANGELTPLRDESGVAVGFVKVLRDRTAEHRAQEALKQADAQLRRAQTAGGVGVFTIDLNQDIVQATPEFCRIFGLPERDHMPCEIIERMVIPQDAPLVSTAEGRRSGNASLQVEFRIHRGDTGEIRVISRKSEYEFDSAGRPVRMVGVVQDVTERHAVQRALQESAAQFMTFAQAMPNQVWTSLPDGQLDWFNEQVYLYSGAKFGELDGSGWTQIVHADDLPDAASRWSAALASGEIYETEFRLRRADGEYRWHLARALPIRAADGSIIRWIGTNTDINERKTVERALARDQQRIWTLSPVLKVVASADGRLNTTNPAWTNTLGWSSEETHGKSIIDFLPSEELSLGKEWLKRLEAHEAVHEQQLTFVAKDGGLRQIAWTFVSENDTLYGFGRDVTDQRMAEEALRQSQKMEAVGQLTGGIAHDFNNLLQGITGSLDLVQKRISQGRLSELDRFVAGAMASANRASALTHRLLAFSRRQPLNPRPVRANPLIASMEDLLRRSLGERVDLELVLAGGLWLTRCDPNQLESAILNLVINARDAMPEGGKLIIETCNTHLDSRYTAQQRDLKPGQYVCVSVSDTGTGMSPETVARAFEPFFTTKPLGHGTGLGLSMIYGFARQSEGHARIYSELGKGSTIRLYLPRHRGEANEEESLPYLSDTHSTEAGETVLVIEDESVVRGLIVEVLSDLGYTALEAADGPKGLEILQSRRRIDLLVTDVGLPGLNGRQVADAGRAIRPRLKVLFMTGYAENAAIASGFLEPGMQMITKPFAMEVLASRIRDMIGS
jgi:PAS domain S-box-containing protein